MGSWLGRSNLNQELTAMTVKLEDAQGAPVSIDANGIVEEFKKTGKLIVPKITEGCKLYLHFKNGPYSGFSRWEMEFEESIPVYHASFKFTGLKKSGYDFKAYNGLNEEPIQEDGSFETHRWFCNKVLPFSPELPYGDYSRARPKLVAVARRTTDNEAVANWKDAIKLQCAQKMKHPFFYSDAECRAKAFEIASGSAGQWDKALAIFAFVRDSITPVEEKDFESLDNLLKTRQGSRWEIAELLRVMFTAISLEPDILLVRKRSDGGFDTSFPQTFSLHDPLVTFVCQGRRYVADPETRAFALGDYPQDYFDLSGASVRYFVPEKIPKPLHEIQKLIIDQEPVAYDERKIRLRMHGSLAAELRAAILESGSGGGLSAVQQFVRRRIGSLQVYSYQAKGVDDAEQPLDLSLKTNNPHNEVSQGDKIFRSWQSALSIPFWFYDDFRSDAYYFPSVIRVEDNFHLPGGTGWANSPSCQNKTDALFQVYCSLETVKEGVVIHRIVDISAGRFSTDAWHEQSKTILNMNNGSLKL